MNLGRGRYTAVLVALSALALLVSTAGCGGEDKGKKQVVEGEPLFLGDLKFNVQLTRFLNPDDPEDKEYLSGQQVPPPADKEYLAVFMEIDNEGSEDARLPTASEMTVVDTTGRKFAAIDSTSDFALELGTTVGPGDEAPKPDTAAASGPVQGSIVLFLVGKDVGENRPLELEISYSGEDGTIELDI
jgi:hypothetical protein